MPSDERLVIPPSSNEQLRALLRERQGLWCDSPNPGEPYPDYACGKCWTCRVRAVLAESPVETTPELERLRQVEENVERVACWVNPNDVYLEVRRMRDDIYAAREARRRAVKTSAPQPPETGHPMLCGCEGCR
jgi:hypothetical protein